jgi:DNA-binding NarL/FixJ family response regulator
MSEAGTKIHIVLVDDQTLLREGFRRLIELEGDDLQVVATAADGLLALTAIESMARAGQLPDVVLMDIRMPHLDGVQATAQIHQRWPAVRVMMLTTFDDEEYVVEGLRAGAKGYLLKDASVHDLVAAIRAVYRGESPLQPSVAAKLVARISRGSEPVATAATPAVAAHDAPYADELTEREHEILRYLARGANNREISEALFITEGTVKNHVSNVLNKLGLRDRTQAAIYAREHGLI